MTVITDIQTTSIDVNSDVPSDAKNSGDNTKTMIQTCNEFMNNNGNYKLDTTQVIVTTSSDDEDSSDSDSSENAGAIERLENGVPSFSNVSIVNSSDIHFGNRTVYQGPVTIKQFLYPNGDKNGAVEEGEKQETAYDNKGFASDSDVYCDIEKKTNDVDVPCESDTIGNNNQSQDRSAKLTKGFIWLQNIPKQRPLEIGIFLTIILLSLCILLLVLFWKHPVNTTGNAIAVNDSDEQDKILPVDYQNELNNNSASNKLHIVTRQQWVAQPPIQSIDDLPIPVKLVIIHHTATENCSSQAQCVFHVRYIQTFHIESSHFYDIGYNFLVGGDGNAYEGRGWKKEGAHTFGYNSRSIGIAFIGSFLKEKPPLRQILACKKLIQKGVDLGFISKDYKILAVRQLRSTESPGLALFEEIQTWPHWSKEP